MQRWKLHILYLAFLTQSFTNECIAETGKSLAERFFHNPYTKISVQFPIIKNVNGYSNAVYSDFHDKPNFRPFYSFGIGNKFRSINIELEGFYLNLPSKTYLPKGVVSTTNFNAMGAFLNVSYNVIKKVFVGVGLGVSKNIAQDIVWTYNSGRTNAVARGQSQIKPAFQVFVGTGFSINQNFTIEGLLKYMDFNKFATKDIPVGGIYQNQGYLRALIFSLNLKYEFNKYKCNNFLHTRS